MASAVSVNEDREKQEVEHGEGSWPERQRRQAVRRLAQERYEQGPGRSDRELSWSRETWRQEGRQEVRRLIGWIEWFVE
jgi:hypothetical protein